MFAIANFSRFIMVRAYVERHRHAGDHIRYSHWALLTFAFTLAEGLWICTSASAAFLANRAVFSITVRPTASYPVTALIWTEASGATLDRILSSPLKRIELSMEPNESGFLKAFDFAPRRDIHGCDESLLARPKGVIRIGPG
jgi:hypothetical protein